LLPPLPLVGSRRRGAAAAAAGGGGGGGGGRLELQHDFQENGQWEIVHGAALQHQGLHEDVTFILVIRRKPLFYIINVLVPSVLLTMLAVSTFYLPPDAGECTRLYCTRALLHGGLCMG
ncbi:acetylcholine receptor subunit beta-like, partial [Lagopus leucura]|uniref:acetylcholine receptor subunit beta-like n=1 Tax=Lagopus leucura TaxID=30410 RepID=UPI001C67E93B